MRVLDLKEAQFLKKLFLVIGRMVVLAQAQAAILLEKSLFLCYQD